MDKKTLRTVIKNKLNGLDESDYSHYSAQIHKLLFNNDIWKVAHTVALTISRGREVDTLPIIYKAWKEGKRVVVPKCEPSTSKMIFREIRTFNQLEQSFFGLLEPIVPITKEVGPADINLMIVPGVCYDRNGYRIGYGGGYYDRYLTQYKNDTVSLAFSLQVVHHVPRETHDIPVTSIITESGAIK